MLAPLETARAVAQNGLLAVPFVRRLAIRTHITGIDGDPALARAAFDLLAAHAPLEEARLLELGPGRTLAVLELARAAGAAGLAAADIVPHVAPAVARARGIDYRLYAGRRLPWPEATFDVVFAYYSLQHVRWPVQTVTEIARVLRPGGRLVCRVDLRDHYHMYDAGREFDCLRYADWLWRLMAWNRGCYVNRLRCPDWLALLAAAKLRVFHLHRHRDPQLVARNRGHRYLAHLPDEELATYRFDTAAERVG